MRTHLLDYEHRRHVLVAASAQQPRACRCLHHLRDRVHAFVGVRVPQSSGDERDAVGSHL
ncbi:unnamed protein product [Linum tenue]|uniref:Uncharacterized protein n=1 Tax=Linum tenue TaxID=586396 RepID=A0AAV0PTJ4_9ROSI|nr:unnamed protein product [Linum tenue]